MISSEVGTGKSELIKLFSLFVNNYINNSIPFIKIPTNVTYENLENSIDVSSFITSKSDLKDKNLFERANSGFIILDNLHLLNSSITNYIINSAILKGIPILGNTIPDSDISISLIDKVAFLIHEKKLVDIELIKFLKLFNSSTQYNFENKYNEVESIDLSEKIHLAQLLLHKINVLDNAINQIIDYATKHSVIGERALIFATKAARAHCALRGSTIIENIDIQFAIATVLSPRAERISDEHSNEDTEKSPKDNCNDNEEDNSEELNKDSNKESDKESNKYLEDELDNNNVNEKPLYENSNNLFDDKLESNDESSLQFKSTENGKDNNFENSLNLIKEELFSSLNFNNEINLSDNLFNKDNNIITGNHSEKTNYKRGRFVRSIKRNTKGNQISILSTIIQAIPFQKIRGRKDNERLILKIEDLRVKQFISKSGTLFVFCVDASGSMAQNRMRETKGAVIKLLQSAYINRDKVAMVVFRKDEAEIVLNQTGSIEKAKRELDILPTGGGTPLADGLYKSLEIALKAKKINLQSVIIILTDGRANIPMNKDIAMMLNNVRQDAVRKEIILLGDSYKKYNIKSMIIDTRSVYSTKSEAFQIANLINAQYFHLPIVTTDEVVKLVRNAL